MTCKFARLVTRRNGYVLEANLRVLTQYYPLPGIAELIERKTAGAEGGELQPDELMAHLPTLSRLESELASAFEASTLPEAPTTLAALDDFIVRIVRGCGPEQREFES